MAWPPLQLSERCRDLRMLLTDAAWLGRSASLSKDPLELLVVKLELPR
jgi:hypothetical protein